MKKRPLVSIIIPTYRRTAWLREALDSVAAQTFSDYEVLVMDDGTPGVENAALCSNYPFVRYFKLANSGGPIVPRNRGLQEARANWSPSSTTTIAGCPISCNGRWRC